MVAHAYNFFASEDSYGRLRFLGSISNMMRRWSTLMTMRSMGFFA